MLLDDGVQRDGGGGDTDMRTQPSAVLHALDNRQRWLMGGGVERGVEGAAR